MSPWRSPLTTKQFGLLLRALVLLLAAGGSCAFVVCAWTLFQRPRIYARGDSFITMEVHKSADSTVPAARIYFEAPSSADDLRFEGRSLAHEFRGLPHPEVSTLRPGVVVSGSGKAIFHSAVIDIADGEISINGRPIRSLATSNIWLGTPDYEIRDDSKPRARDTLNQPRPLEVILGGNGWYCEGYIRIVR